MGSIHSMYLGDEPSRILSKRERERKERWWCMVAALSTEQEEDDLTVLMLLSTQNHEMRVSVS